ncbi:MAG: lipoprotein-releasing ABC transporter permease subunit [Hyphomicrobiaceae bacterium]|nr:MAG: lipoprotein-releasing ABC transporter permease subunit [Hyphomicrobiaceae bacterium]
MAEKDTTPPFAGFEWLVAGRYLRARRKEGFLSIIAIFSFLGIMLGVATLIIVMAVMNGFRKELFEKIVGLNGHIVIDRHGFDFPDYEAINERVKRVSHVKHTFPLIDGQVMASTSAAPHGIYVRGVREADIKTLEFVAKRIKDGTLDGFDTSEGLVIGLRMANILQAGVGDHIVLVSPRGATTPFGVTPRTKRYKVVAIFELGMSAYDSTIAFMPFAEAQRFFNKQEQASVLEVVTTDANLVASVKEGIKAGVAPDLRMVDWRERNSHFLNALYIERIVMFIIVSLIVLVAALNIISGLMMLVKDKGREIAVMRTMGATKGAVMRIFLITGASIGVTGTIAGFFLGMLFCWNIESVREFITWLTSAKVFDSDVYFLKTMPADIDPVVTGLVVVMALALSVLATLYPSWRASRLDPVEALRYE